VLGCVEAHGRPEIARLLEGLVGAAYRALAAGSQRSPKNPLLVAVGADEEGEQLVGAGKRIADAHHVC
jgi:K+-sensing histidine kinase KdpD